MADVSVLSCRPIIEAMERDLGITIDTIAQALEVDRRTVERWRANQSMPQGRSRQRLSELVALHDQLLRKFEAPGTVQQWLRTRSRYLDGLTPEEALKAGRLDRVRADLDGLAAGVYL
jgi:hypothetical protein